MKANSGILEAFIAQPHDAALCARHTPARLLARAARLHDISVPDMADRDADTLRSNLEGIA